MHRLRNALLVLLVAVLGVGAVVIARMLSTPAWVSRAAPDCADGRDGTPEGTAHRIARELESQLASDLHRIRPDGEEWELDVNLAAAQAWLDCRLPEWVAHTDDAELQALAAEWGTGVTLGEGSAGVVVALHREWGCAAAEVIATRSGDKWVIRPAQAWVGTQRVPLVIAAMVFGELPSAEVSARWELADGRAVLVDRIEVAAGVVRLHCCTMLSR